MQSDRRSVATHLARNRAAKVSKLVIVCLRDGITAEKAKSAPRVWWSIAATAAEVNEPSADTIRDTIASGSTIVNDADFERFSRLSWRLWAGGYAGRGKCCIDGRYVVLFLHREILGLPAGVGLAIQVDHINLDRLDNRRANLRIVTAAENRQNRRTVPNKTSAHRGVYRRLTRTGAVRWRAVVKVSGRTFNLGHFHDEADAARAAAAFRAAHVPFSSEAIDGNAIESAPARGAA